MKSLILSGRLVFAGVLPGCQNVDGGNYQQGEQGANGHGNEFAFIREIRGL
jgi:hypothetical protein